MREDLLRQFSDCGEVELAVKDLTFAYDYSSYDEIVVLTDSDGDACKEDCWALEMIESIARAMKTRTAGQSRPVVHVLLQTWETLTLIRTRDYKDTWHQWFELNVFTVEDIWAQKLLVATRNNDLEWGLDYLPVTYDSNHTVHLVVFGTSSQTEALVMNTLLVAHYPNYVRNHALRTRITIIGNDMHSWKDQFISRHKSLMDNSFYRYIDIAAQMCVVNRPMYEERLEDFVDVEWEFVDGGIENIVVQDKLVSWAESAEQLLSVAICHDDDNRNLSEMRIAGDLLQKYELPIYVRQRNSRIVGTVGDSFRYRNVLPFGMLDNGYDVTLPLLETAKKVKWVYDFCYNVNVASENENRVLAPATIALDELDDHWQSERTAVKRYSCLCNAMTLPTKMRSLGHNEKDWGTFYAISQQEIDIIGKVEHNRWSAEELALGFRPCTVAEQQEIEADISQKAEYKKKLVHYDLRAYDDLRADDTGKNVQVYDLCLSAAIPLLMYSAFNENKKSLSNED